MNLSYVQDHPRHIDINLDSSNLQTSGPRLACLVKTDWINASIRFEKLNEGLSNKLLAMFPSSTNEQGLIVRVYGKNSDLIIDREREIRTMVRLHRFDMASAVLLTFNNGFLYTFVPGEQIDVTDQTVE